MSMKLNPLHIIVICLMVLGGILAYDALTSSMNPYMTVSEVTRDPVHLNTDVQVLATVATWSMDTAGTMHIVLTDGNASIEVFYTGVPPQGLTQGQKIVAIGELSSAHQLNATQLLVKCPSKYE